MDAAQLRPRREFKFEQVWAGEHRGVWSGVTDWFVLGWLTRRRGREEGVEVELVRVEGGWGLPEEREECAWP